MEISGQIISNSPLKVAITKHGTVLTINGISTDGNLGDHIAVYGILRADNSIDARGAIFHPREFLFYTWGVSFIAGVWVLLRIVTGWHFDPDTFAMAPNPDDYNWRTLAGKILK